MGLKEDFLTAASDVLNLSNRPDNESLLKLYAYYKQGDSGDVSGPRPGMLNLVARKKYDAWAKLKGITKDEAQKKYIELVEVLKSKDK